MLTLNNPIHANHRMPRKERVLNEYEKNAHLGVISENYAVL